MHLCAARVRSTECICLAPSSPSLVEAGYELAGELLGLVRDASFRSIDASVLTSKSGKVKLLRLAVYWRRLRG